MATSAYARRRGYASAVLAALLQAGSDRGVAGYWLLVTAANSGAQALYANSGFRESGRYVYRQERPRRALTGC
jgi:ribosomal protein S18 acetylase RimI-like enzyme